ncbi:MAG: hypothetical protein R3E97_09050 [Candidatus Eisenbacteria bacterium]
MIRRSAGGHGAMFGRAGAMIGRLGLTGRAPALASAGALVFAAAGGQSAPVLASVVTRIGAEHEAVTFETYQGEVSVDQTRIPFDVIGGSAEFGWQVGFDFASSHAEDWTGDGPLRPRRLPSRAVLLVRIGPTPSLRRRGPAAGRRTVRR